MFFRLLLNCFFLVLGYLIAFYISPLFRLMGLAAIGAGIYIVAFFSLPACLIYLGRRRRAYRQITDAFCQPYRPCEMPLMSHQDDRLQHRYRAIMLGLLSLVIMIVMQGETGAIDYVFRMQSADSFVAIVGLATLWGVVFYSCWQDYQWKDDPQRLNSITLQFDHLVIADATGMRRVFLFDEGTQVSVRYREVFGGFFLMRYYRRSEVVFSIKDAAGEATIPFVGEGAGQLLELCRRSGVKVSVEAETRIGKRFAQLAAEVAARLAPPATYGKPAGPSKALLCASCGAKVMQVGEMPAPVCDYCGSSKLSPFNG